MLRPFIVKVAVLGVHFPLLSTSVTSDIFDNCVSDIDRSYLIIFNLDSRLYRV